MATNYEGNKEIVEPIAEPISEPIAHPIAEPMAESNQNAKVCDSDSTVFDDSESVKIEPKELAAETKSIAPLRAPDNVPTHVESTLRNPITGIGLEAAYNRKRINLRQSGNPVTGEGYIVHQKESEPRLNGVNEKIMKNQVPPGGFSSGLW